MNTTASPFARQLFRDERKSRIDRINELSRQVALCLEAKAYDSALVMQFIELDTWAFLTRPAHMGKHDKHSFMWFIERFMPNAPGQGYAYAPKDVYAARCGLLHTFGALADMHTKDPAIVVRRYHLGKQNTLVPGLDRMAYISVKRFTLDAMSAVSACLKEVMADNAMNALVGERLPRVYFLAGVLPSRDPDDIAAMDPAIDAEIAAINAGGSDEPISIAGHTMVRGVCQG